MSSSLEKLLAPGALGAVFQPVFHAQDDSRRQVYLEALIRGPRATTLESPRALFAYARKKHAEVQVERVVVRTLLSEARKLPPSCPIGINVHAATLSADLEFLDFLGDCANEFWIEPRRLVVELVDGGMPYELMRLREAIACLRAIGARVALDDFGVGQSNLALLAEVRPEFLKTARSLVAPAAHSPTYRAVLRSVVLLGAAVGARVVAEGIQEDEELKIVRDLGVNYVQGTLFGKPLPAPELAAESCQPMGVSGELLAR